MASAWRSGAPWWRGCRPARTDGGGGAAAARARRAGGARRRGGLPRRGGLRGTGRGPRQPGHLARAAGRAAPRADARRRSSGWRAPPTGTRRRGCWSRWAARTSPSSSGSRPRRRRRCRRRWRRRCPGWRRTWRASRRPISAHAFRFALRWQGRGLTMSFAAICWYEVPQFVMGANWLRRRMEDDWCAPRLVSRPRKKQTKQKRERAHGSRGLEIGHASPRDRRVAGTDDSSGWPWAGGEPPCPGRDQRVRT